MTQQNIKISEEEYIKLCEKACEGYQPSGNLDEDRTNLFRRILRAVQNHLEDRDAMGYMVGEATPLQSAVYHLQQYVFRHQNQFSEFEILGTANEQINRILKVS